MSAPYMGIFPEKGTDRQNLRRAESCAGLQGTVSVCTALNRIIHFFRDEGFSYISWSETQDFYVSAGSVPHMPLAELFRCDTGTFFENPEEIFYIVVAHGPGDLVHFPVGVGQELLGAQDTDIV